MFEIEAVVYSYTEGQLQLRAAITHKMNTFTNRLCGLKNYNVQCALSPLQTTAIHGVILHVIDCDTSAKLLWTTDDCTPS